MRSTVSSTIWRRPSPSSPAAGTGTADRRLRRALASQRGSSSPVGASTPASSTSCSLPGTTGQMKIDELGANDDADAKESAGKPEGGSTGPAEKPRNGGDENEMSTRHVGILEALADDSPAALLAHSESARVEYFSSTLSLWFSGKDIRSQAVAHTLNNTNASNKYNSITKLVPDHSIKSSNGQLRYDVLADEELQKRKRVEARVDMDAVHGQRQCLGTRRSSTRSSRSLGAIPHRPAPARQMYAVAFQWATGSMPIREVIVVVPPASCLQTRRSGT